LVAGKERPIMVAELRAVARENEIPDAFSDFWLLYPRRVARKDARKAWDRIPDSLHARIFTALVDWRVIWRDKDVEYLPYPATWLNGERWEDEVPAEYKRSNLSHVPVAPAAPSARTPLPDHVRSLLAKLRGKA
jgi:hypothetical protein